MFEQGTRQKIRFEVSGGILMMEDLYDLTLLPKEYSRTKDTDLCLDNIEKALKKELKSSKEKSYVIKKSKADSLVQLKLDIVRRVIDTKLKEAEDSETDAERKAYKQKILGLIEKKENQALEEDTSLEELKKIAQSL